MVTKAVTIDLSGSTKELVEINAGHRRKPQRDVSYKYERFVRVHVLGQNSGQFHADRSGVMLQVNRIARIFGLRRPGPGRPREKH